MSIVSTTWPDPRFTPRRLEELRAEALGAERDPFFALLANVKLLGSAGRKPEAQEMLRQGEPQFPPDEVRDGQFRNLLPAAIIVGGAGLARAWFSKRFKPPYAIDFEVIPSTTSPDVVRLTVQGNTAKFSFQAGLFQSPAVEPILNRWVDIFKLFDRFMTSPQRVDGSVDINLGDSGLRPGLAFCANSAGYFLIPDATYLDLSRYVPMRDRFRDHLVPWEERRRIAFWRGTTSGKPSDPAIGWRSLPRLGLCRIGTENPDVLDVGITGVTQIDDPVARDWMASRNLLREHVPSESFQQYRYQIDIDGNSSAWAGLFIKLLTGSPVLKVASPEGYQQWYYDRLQPWINYIPVGMDMTDLVEKVEWLRAHDDIARRIGEAGRALADDLTGEQEIARTTPVFAAAIRTAAHTPSIDLRFAAGASGLDVTRTGWLAPETDGMLATGFESRLEIAKPHGLGDFILIADISPVVPAPRRVAIIANGEVISQRTLTERTKVYCPLPNRVACGNEILQLCFCLPDSRPNAGRNTPLDTRSLSVTLHRVAVASAHCFSGDEHPDLAAALAKLRASRAEPMVHDLWGPRRSLPPQARPFTIRTFHDTIIYADLRTGRLRHGPRTSAPRNLVLVSGTADAALMRVTETGALFGVQLRPEGPHAAQADLGSLSGEGIVSRLEVTANGDPDRKTFCIRGAGLYLCAEPGGDITLSRVVAGPWERFGTEANQT